MGTIIVNVDVTALPGSHAYILGPSGELGKELPEGTFILDVTGYGALKIATHIPVSGPGRRLPWPKGQVTLNDGRPVDYGWLSNDQPTELNITIRPSGANGTTFSAAFSSTQFPSNTFPDGNLLAFPVQELPVQSVPVTSLKLSVQTGTASGSWFDGPSTDSDISVKIGSSDADTGWVDLDNWGDDFQTGQWDHYNIPPNGLRMNQLRSVRLIAQIQTTLTIFNDAWNIGHLKITANGVVVYDKQLDKWINSLAGSTGFSDTIVDFIESDGTSLWMPYDRCCFMCTHNAFAAQDSGWWICQQSYSIKRQLELGVRSLMLDVWPYPYPSTSSSEAYLCHELKQWQGKGVDILMKPFSQYKSLVSELADIKSYMDSHQTAVITLIFESYVNDIMMQRAFASVPGLNELIFWADRSNAGHSVATSGWPTLAWMVEKKKRLVVFTSRPTDGFPRVWNYAVENNYGDASLDPTKWINNRRESSKLSTADKKLCILNHFPDISARAVAWSTILTLGTFSVQNYFQDQVNDSKSIAGQVRDLKTHHHRTPNFIAVDFFELGKNGGVEEVCRGVNKDVREQHPARKRFQTLAVGPDTPKPPFDITEYPIRPIQAGTGDEWAQGVLGQSAWSPASLSGGNFNKELQCMEGVDDPNVRGLWGVICQGAPNAMRTVSYICVGGPAARYVDIAVYPASFGKIQHSKYVGWNGESFREGPAVNTGGYYWYRYAGHWLAPFQDSQAVFYAKTYRHPNDGSDKSFKLWAFTHEVEVGPSEDVLLNPSGAHHKQIKPSGEFIVNGKQLGVGTWQTYYRFLVFVEAWGGLWWVGDLVDGGMKSTTVRSTDEIWKARPSHFEPFTVGHGR